MNRIYYMPVLALGIAAFTGFCLAVILLLALGIAAGIITLVTS